MKKLVSILSFIVWCTLTQAQEKLIYGYILEQRNEVAVPDGATLSLRDSTGITEPIQKKSNRYNGYFELLVDEKYETLIISKDGYQTREVDLKVHKGFIPNDSLSLTRNLQLDYRAYTDDQSTSFITTGLNIERKIYDEKGEATSTTLFAEDEAIKSILLTQSKSERDSLVVTSEVYESRTLSIASFFDSLQASQRINFILSDTLEATKKLFFQQGISTAGKRNQSLGQIPASVVIVSKEEIAAQGYQSVPEVLENVTGLYLFRDYSWSGGDPILGMRGFFSQGFNNDIIILINGVNMYEEYWGFYPFSRFPIAVEAIDRIEIVRGPMSVLYGSGAFFGAINIITNAPLDSDVKDDETFPKHFAVSYGSRDTRRVSGGLKYKKDRVSFSFNANMLNTDGLDQSFSRFLPDSSENNLIAANLGIRNTREMLSSEQRYISTSISLQDKAGLTQYSIDLTASSENRGVFESTVANSNTLCRCPIPLANPDAVGVINRSNSAYGGLRITHSPRESDLNLNLSMFFHEYKTNIDYDAGGNRIGQSSFLSKAFETEISASQTIDRLSGIVGLNARIASDLFTTFDTPDSLLGAGNNFIRIADEADLNFVSAFSEFEYQIVPGKLALTGGVRVEQLSEFSYLRNDTTQNSNLAVPPLKSGNIASDPVFIPRGALVWTMNPTNFLKFLYGEASKRPSFGNFTDTEALEFPRIRTFELNFIREGKGEEGKTLRTRLNASIYHNSIENLLSRVSSVTTGGQPTFFSGNTRNVNTTGGELGVMVHEPGTWSIELSGSVNRSNEEQQFEAKDITGQSPSFSPWLLAYLKANYRWKTIFFDLSTGLNLRYVSESESGLSLIDNEPVRLGNTTDDYTVSNLNLRLSRSSLKEDENRNKLRNLYLAFQVSNLFDVDIQYPTTGNNQTWATDGSPGFGRRFFITLGVDL